MVYSKNGELRFDDICMEGSKNSAIKLQKCTDGNQKQTWDYNNQVNFTFDVTFQKANVDSLLDTTN